MGIVEELKKKYDIEDIWYGLEIHPETPQEGTNLIARFGEQQLKMMFANLNKAGAKYNVKFSELATMYNSKNSLLAAEYARVNSKYHEYHELLMRSYFTDLKNIGSIEVLCDIGFEVGLDTLKMKESIVSKEFEGELDKASKMAKDKQISSTPTFIINDKHVIVGAQDISKFVDIIEGRGF